MTKARINDFIEELIELSDKFGIYVGSTNDSAGYLPALYDISGKCVAKDFEYRSPEEEEHIKDCYSYHCFFKYGDKIDTPAGVGTYIGEEYNNGEYWAHVMFENDPALHMFRKAVLEVF